MRSLVPTFALVVAWLCANGALWDAMQLMAWGKMFVGYSESMTVSAALQETLDPAKPCEMCKGIAKARSATENEVPPTDHAGAPKFVLVIHTVEAPFFSNSTRDWFAAARPFGTERTDPVPLPPPRV